MEPVETRKIQAVGNRSFSVSRPMGWVLDDCVSYHQAVLYRIPKKVKPIEAPALAESCAAWAISISRGSYASG